ncbi:hypothetical protein OGZ01_21455 [Vibrio harveyi]|nr:hypothetical protein [Vibrio harveyi]
MDLATEPRWYRVHETFTEDADLAADIMRSLINGLQGGGAIDQDSIALTIKHFPGEVLKKTEVILTTTLGKTKSIQKTTLIIT